MIFENKLMKLLILFLFLSCSDPIKPRVFTANEAEFLSKAPLDVKVYIESCLSKNNTVGMQYCLDRLMERRNPPCSSKTSTGEIATGVGVGIVGGHLIKGLLK